MNQSIKLVFYICSFIFLGSTIGNAQTTAIPDTAFEQKLVSLGIDSDGLVNGQILNSDAASVTDTLDVSHGVISDMTGIGAFINVTTLYCNNNKITTLDVTNNTLLEGLWCGYNPFLTKLNVNGCTNLQTLYCEFANIDTLDMSTCGALQELFCPDNSLTSLNLTGCTSLLKVGCHVNQLSTLDLSTCISLIELDCQVNQLTSLDVSNCQQLLDLDCRYNQLSTLDVNPCTSLTHLLCDNNQLSSLMVNNNSTLKWIYCGHNQLTTLDVSGCSALEFLWGTNNLLTTLDVSPCSSLFQLDCNRNSIVNLDVTGCINLARLGCSENQLASLDLSTCPGLDFIYCYDNQLTTLDVSACSNLTKLHCYNNQLTTLNLDGCVKLEDLRCQDNLLHYLNLTNKPDLPSLTFSPDSVVMRNNLPGMEICVDDIGIAKNSPYWSKGASATYTEICHQTTLMGYAHLDTNANCIPDSIDPIMSGVLVQAIGNNNTVYMATNSTGGYAGMLDTGSYVLNMIMPSPYHVPCLTPQTVTIDSINDLDTVNWAVEVTHTCPYLKASLAAPFLRATGGGSAYTVHYCNHGTAPAYDAYIEVTIDGLLNVLGTGLPILNQVGNVYTFDLDTIDIGECGSFNINVVVDTSAAIGQTHCSEVHIYPDSFCGSPWTGPVIEAEGTCLVDTIEFRLKNIGSSMLMAHNYSIFEDHVMLMTVPFTLGAGVTTVVKIATNQGSTYRIEAGQDPNYPPALGASITHATVVGCKPFLGGGFNVGVPLSYNNNNSSTWVDIDCQESIAAYDPNDKTPQPIGFDSAHYITRGTYLDYKVRFQNTGNDTAFNVVIVDPISPHLDLSTLQMKSASHPYTWELTNGNELRVTFADIKLVDSTTNEPLSHGFFTYEIQQQPNLPLGTVINNTAAIYFDYNPPILTNTTYHTIGENFIPQIVLEVNQVANSEISIKAYPNPFKEQTTIEVEGAAFESLELLVTDVAGRVVKQQLAQHESKIQLHRKNLQSGVYFYQLKGDGTWIGSGKLMVR